MAAEADLSVLVRYGSRQQRIRVQGSGGIHNRLSVIQAEYETFAGQIDQFGVSDALLVGFRSHDFLLLMQGDSGGHIVIGRNDADRNSGRFVIPGFQQHIVTGTVEDVPSGSRYLRHIVMAQRQQLGFCHALRVGRNGGSYFVCFEPESAILSDNILHGTHLERSSGQGTFVVQGRMHRITEGVLVFIESGQHRPLLLHLNQSLDRSVRNGDFLNIHGFRQRHHGEAENQQKQYDQESRGFVFCKIHPLYLVSLLVKREKAADLSAAR